MGDKCFLVHYNAKVTHSKYEGVVYDSEEQKIIFANPSITFLELRKRVIDALEREGVAVRRLHYRLPVACTDGVIKFSKFKVNNDAETAFIFTLGSAYPDISVHELNVELVETSRVSSRGSRERPPSVGIVASGGVGSGGHGTPGSGSGTPVSRPIPLRRSVPYESPTVQGQSQGNVGLDLDNVGLEDVQLGTEGDSYDLSDFDLNNNVEDEEELENVGFVADGGEEDDEEEEELGGYAVEESMPPNQRPSITRPSHYDGGDARDVGDAGGGEEDVVQGGDFGGRNEFQVGQVFPNRDTVKYVVKQYSIRRFAQYKVHESSPSRFLAKCLVFGAECNWSIRVSYIQQRECWIVRKYTGPHTCQSVLPNDMHRQLDSDVICHCIFPIVESTPNVKISVLEDAVQKEFGIRTTYRKVWMAKQKAIAKIYGDWEASYNDLPTWIQGMQLLIPGFVVRLETMPYSVNDVIYQGRAMFHRMFWSFPQCIEGFKYCKPLVSIDGTHLYGRYGGTLLMAIAQDGNNNILPIAFAVVEGETQEAWSFFLKNLRQHVTPQQGILVISDRHRSIKAALEEPDSGWHEPSAYHVYCIRHIASNFALRFRSKEAKKALINAAYSKTESGFHYYCNKLRQENPRMLEWAQQIPENKWAQYADNGRRYGHMTTNLSECINNTMKGSRNLPITALVRSTYYRLASTFVKRGQTAEAQLGAGAKWSERLLKKINKNSEHLGSMTVRVMNRAETDCVVKETKTIGGHGTMDSFSVNLANRQCSCGEFEALHFPCRHALACCAKLRYNWDNYTDEVYSVPSLFNVYMMEFPALRAECEWPRFNGISLWPNPAYKRVSRGRPKSTRIRNEMDQVEGSTVKLCGLCRQAGHTRRICPQAPSSSSGRQSAT